LVSILFVLVHPSENSICKKALTVEPHRVSSVGKIFVFVVSMGQGIGRIRLQFQTVTAFKAEVADGGFGKVRIPILKCIGPECFQKLALGGKTED